MANSRIVLTLAGVFLAGVGSGMLGMRYGLHDQMHAAASAAAAQPNESEVLERFRHELNLTDDQTKKLAVVLEDYRHYYQAVQEQIEEMRLRDQIDDLRSTGKNRILEILNSEQRQKFEKMTGVDPATPAASK